MSGSFVEVFVEPCACAEDGLVLRFMRAGAEGAVIHEVFYEDDEGREGWWSVRAALDDEEASQTDATATLVQDSSAGTSLLITGGTHGLSLVLVSDPSARVRVPYLVLSRDARVR
jgi:hypothetical protein